MTLTMILPADAPLRTDDLVAFEAIHRALRHQVRALVGALRELDDGDRRGAAELRDWFDHVDLFLAHHHRVVGELILPALEAEDAAARDLAGATRAGNAVVADHADMVAHALTGLEGLAALRIGAGVVQQRRAAVAAAEALARAIDEHTERTAATLLPALVRSLPRARWNELQGELVVHVEPRLLPFVYPWLLAGAPSALAERVVVQLPRMLRTVHRFVWTPNHERTYPRIAAAGARPAEAA